MDMKNTLFNLVALIQKSHNIEELVRVQRTLAEIRDLCAKQMSLAEKRDEARESYDMVFNAINSML